MWAHQSADGEVLHEMRSPPPLEGGFGNGRRERKANTRPARPNETASGGSEPHKCYADGPHRVEWPRKKLEVDTASTTSNLTHQRREASAMPRSRSIVVMLLGSWLVSGTCLECLSGGEQSILSDSAWPLLFPIPLAVTYIPVSPLLLLEKT